jgi:hypothetical protein
MEEYVNHMYDDDMCMFLDPSVKPNQIRSSIMNELKSEKKGWEVREVIWMVDVKRAISYKRR